MTICIHGLGYIGLATGALFANNGHEVVGYDTDRALREELRRGELDVQETELAEYVERALADGLDVRDTPVSADYHLICVPTPYDHADDRADLSHVEAVSSNVASALRPADVVVLESTVPPGATRSVVGPILAESGLEPGEDIGLAYAPETILPGNTVVELRTNDRVVGGVTPGSTRAVRGLYDPVTEGTVYEAPNATTAEFVKLVQNAFRDVNIAFANEVALLANDYGIDARESIRLANNHPRVDVLDPGPGVGGHCIPVDPLFLGQASDETALVDCARRVNDRMPAHVVDRLTDELGTLADTAVAILGIAYKGNVSDTRNSPGLAIARQVEAATVEPSPVADGGWGGTEVRLTDPHVIDHAADLVPLTTALDGADAAVVAAAHDEFAALDPDHVGELLAQRVVVDTLDVLDAAQWTDHGFRVLDL